MPLSFCVRLWPKPSPGPATANMLANILVRMRKPGAPSALLGALRRGGAVVVMRPFSLVSGTAQRRQTILASGAKKQNKGADKPKKRLTPYQGPDRCAHPKLLLRPLNCCPFTSAEGCKESCKS